MVILGMTHFADAQVYQLPNGGFEQWDGNGSDDEPTYWNGFPSSQCDLTGFYAIGCSTAQQTRHERSTEFRPGSTGSTSCKVFATEVSLLGSTIYANGNITTGQIRIGATQATSPENYNITRRNQSGMNQPFNGMPDSLRFWAKFSCPSSTQYARMSAIIHEDYDMMDPYPASEASHIVGVSTCEFLVTNGWQEFVVPFNYTSYSATTPAYLLLTFTTNKIQGAGSGSDMLWVDDVEMIYHAELSDLRSGGTTVEGFDPYVVSYQIELPAGGSLPVVSATALSANATVTITQPTESSPVATVVVNQGPETIIYTINYTFGEEATADLSDLQVDGVTVSGFDPAVTDYQVELPSGAEIPTVSAVAAVATAQVTITQATADNLTASVEVVCGSLTKTYTVTFTYVAANTDLADLLVNGVSIEGFSPDILEYTYMIAPNTALPVVSAVAASATASVEIVQPTLSDLTSTVTVTSGDSVKIYTVSFAISGINEHGHNSFTVFPNPTHDEVTVVMENGRSVSEVVLCDLAGRQVFSAKVNGESFVLNLRALESGIYFISIRGENQVLGVSKIVKQ